MADTEKKPPQIVLPLELLKGIEDDLDLEQCGRLLIGIRDYFAEGRTDTGDKVVNLALKPFRIALDHNAKKYNEIIEKRKAAAEARWARQQQEMQTNIDMQMHANACTCIANDANAFFALQTDANDANININKNKNINQNINLNKNISSSSINENGIATTTTTTDPYWALSHWNSFAQQHNMPQAFNVPELKEALAKGISYCVMTLGRPDPQSAMDEVLAHVANSPYLLGEKTGKRATPQWIFTPTNLIKVLQGAYEDIPVSIQPTKKMTDAVINQAALQAMRDTDWSEAIKQYQNNGTN